MRILEFIHLSCLGISMLGFFSFLFFMFVYINLKSSITVLRTKIEKKNTGADNALELWQIRVYECAMEFAKHCGFSGFIIGCSFGLIGAVVNYFWL